MDTRKRRLDSLQLYGEHAAVLFSLMQLAAGKGFLGNAIYAHSIKVNGYLLSATAHKTEHCRNVVMQSSPYYPKDSNFSAFRALLPEKSFLERFFSGTC